MDIVEQVRDYNLEGIETQQIEGIGCRDVFFEILKYLPSYDLRLLRDVCKNWRLIVNEECIKNRKIILIFQNIFKKRFTFTHRDIGIDVRLQHFKNKYFNEIFPKDYFRWMINLNSDIDKRITIILKGKFFNPHLLENELRTKIEFDVNIIINRDALSPKDKIAYELLKERIECEQRIISYMKTNERKTEIENIKIEKPSGICTTILAFIIFFACNIILSIIPNILAMGTSSIFNFAVLPKVKIGFPHHLVKVLSSTLSGCITILIPSIISFISFLIYICTARELSKCKKVFYSIQIFLATFIGNFISIFSTYFLSFHLSNLTNKIGLKVLRFLAITIFAPFIYSISNTFLLTIITAINFFALGSYSEIFGYRGLIRELRNLFPHDEIEDLKNILIEEEDIQQALESKMQLYEKNLEEIKVEEVFYPDTTARDED